MSVGYSFQFALKFKQIVRSTICLGVNNSECKTPSIEPVPLPTTITLTEQTPVTTEIEVTKVINTIQTIEVFRDLPSPQSPTAYFHAHQPHVTTSDRSSSTFSKIHLIFYVLYCFLLIIVLRYSFRRGQRRYDYEPQPTTTRLKLANRASYPLTYRSKSVQTVAVKKNEATAPQSCSMSSPKLIQQTSYDTDFGQSASLVASYEDILASVREHNRNLLEKNKSLVDLNTSLTDNNDKYLRQWVEESRVASELRKNLVSSEMSKRDIAEKLTNLEKATTNFEEEYATRYQELRQLIKEVKEFRDKSEKEVKELRHTLVSRNEQLKFMREPIIKKQSEKDGLKQELSDNSSKYRDEVNEKTRKIERLESDILMFEEYDKEQGAELEAAESQIGRLKTELIDVRGHLEKQKSSSDSAQEEVAELKKTNIELQDSVNTLNDTVRNLKESENVLSGQLAQKDRLIFNLNIGTANHRTRINNLNNRIDEFQSQTNDLRVEKDSLAPEMEEKVSAALSDKEATEMKLQTVRSKLSDAKTTLNAQAAEINNLKSENASLTKKTLLSMTAFKEHARLGGRTIHTIIVDDGMQDFSNNKRKDRRKATTKRAKAEALSFARDVNFAKSRRLSISAGTSHAELVTNLTLKERGFATREELKSARDEVQRQQNQMQATVTTAIARLPQEKTESNNAFSQLSKSGKADFTANLLTRCEATMPHISLDAFTSTHCHPGLQKESIESRISLWTKPRILSLAAVNANRAMQREQVAAAACKHMYRVQQQQNQKRHSVKEYAEAQADETLCPNHVVSPQIQKVVRSLLGEMDKRLEEDRAEKCLEVCMHFGAVASSLNQNDGDFSLITSVTDANVDGEQNDERDGGADNAAGQRKQKRKRMRRTGNQQV